MSPISSRPLHWYLAQVKPNCAAIAKRNLERQGFECFIPMEHITQRRANRLITTQRPFFSGYAFVGLDPASPRWHAIRSTYGVSRLVGNYAKPTLVPHKIIDELIARIDRDGFIKNEKPLKEGSIVEITHGPLSSFLARVEKLSAEERAWVLVDIVGKSTRVSMARADLRVTQ